MDLKHLRYFIAAVEEGSLQGGAYRLNVAQPALSRRVRDLELDLGCSLLVRGARGVTPTRAGLSLYKDAISLLDGLNHTVQRVRRLGLEQDREIRFGLAPTTSRKFGFVQEALNSFASRCPETGIAYSRGSSNELATRLRSGDLDLALMYEQRPGSSEVEERLIHKERYILAAYPAHRLAREARVEISDLSGERLVWLSRRDIAENHNSLLQQLRRHGVEPIISQLADSPEEQIDLVTAGAGLCLTPASTILTIPKGQLEFKPLPGFSMELDFTLAWQRELSSSMAGVLLALLNEAINEHQRAITSGSPDWLSLDGEALLSLP